MPSPPTRPQSVHFRGGGVRLVGDPPTACSASTSCPAATARPVPMDGTPSHTRVPLKTPPRLQPPKCPCSASQTTNTRTAPLTTPATVPLRRSRLRRCSSSEGRSPATCRIPRVVRGSAVERRPRPSSRGDRQVALQRYEPGLHRLHTRSFGLRATRDIEILRRVIRSLVAALVTRAWISPLLIESLMDNFCHSMSDPVQAGRPTAVFLYWLDAWILGRADLDTFGRQGGCRGDTGEAGLA